MHVPCLVFCSAAESKAESKTLGFGFVHLLELVPLSPDQTSLKAPTAAPDQDLFDGW